MVAFSFPGDFVRRDGQNRSGEAKGLVIITPDLFFFAVADSAVSDSVHTLEELLSLTFQ